MSNDSDNTSTSGSGSRSEESLNEGSGHLAGEGGIRSMSYLILRWIRLRK